MKKTIRNFKFTFFSLEKGMTYVELIVVLSIFSVMTSILLFNYKAFQENIDIKILSNDIALKIVEAQKNAISGKLPSLSAGNYLDPAWKPSYGLSFSNTANNNKQFSYVVDYPNIGSICADGCGNIYNITKGNSISELAIVGDGCPATVTNLNIFFRRPDSGAIISSSPTLACTVSYAQITISSLNSLSTKIKIYSSGRIQIN